MRELSVTEVELVTGGDQPDEATGGGDAIAVGRDAVAIGVAASQDFANAWADASAALAAADLVSRAQQAAAAYISQQLSSAYNYAFNSTVGAYAGISSAATAGQYHS